MLIVSIYHLAGWLGICVVTPAYALGSLGKLVAARLRGERLAAVPASVWSWLLMSLLYLDVGFIVLGHPGPGWLRWLVLPLCAAITALLVIPGIVSRRKAGLAWWRFWTTVPSSTAAPSSVGGWAGPDIPEGGYGPVVVPDAEALIELIRAARFSTTRLQPGYDEEEVDKFLDKLIADLGDGGRLDTAEVRDMKFSTTRLRPGYSEQAVDDFLDEVTSRAIGQALLP